jgi:hypothetical protein
MRLAWLDSKCDYKIDSIDLLSFTWLFEGQLPQELSQLDWLDAVVLTQNASKINGLNSLDVFDSTQNVTW